jgi:predicted phosphodiesterase
MSHEVPMKSTTTKPNQIIGIMADSHGQVHNIARALSFFKRHDCDHIYHLGDICDSAHPETADPCVNLLRQNSIFGIKGNNDHLVVVNHRDRQQAHPSSTTLAYLENLPLVVEKGDIIMTHSLPFVKERGLSSMVGVLGHNEAALFFRTCPRKVLFRGHSHHPELLRQDHQNLRVDKIRPGEIIRIKDIKPGIITCGALDHGFMMIWNRGDGTVACHAFG